MAENEKAQSNRLLVIWSSADRDVALNMVFMYGLNSRLKGWWEQVRLVVWGPSAKLLSVDKELQGKIKEMQDAGVETLACKACADRYGVSDALAELDIDVIYMGMPLTDMLKTGWATLTF